jgi:hypothetical protein
MRNAIRGLEQWEGDAREWSRKAGRMKMKAGAGLVSACESWYAQWKEKPTPRATREYMLWRLRLHLKWNGDPEFLEELDETFNLGLHDDEPGETYWEVQPEQPTGFTSGFNWRRDSGNALRGQSPYVEKPEEDVVE